MESRMPIDYPIKMLFSVEKRETGTKQILIIM